MKKIILTASALFIGMVSFAQATWTKVAIDEKVSVMMPATPQKNETQQMISYLLTTADSSFFNVNIIDFSAFGMDSAMLQGMVPEESFMEQFKAGFIQQMQNAEVLESKMSNLNKYTVYEFIIEVTNESGVKRKMHNYNLFVGSKDYSFTFSAKANEAEQKEKFLKSIEVK